MSNAVVEETPMLQGNSVTEENTEVMPAKYAEEDSTSAAAYAEEIPTHQDNAVVEENTEVMPAKYTDEASTAAAVYTEEVPTLQDNTVVEEDTTVTAATPTDETEAPDARPRTDIVGSVAVSDDVTIGGGTRVGDNALFKRDVTVEGWLDAPNIRGKLKERLEYIEGVASDAKDTAHTGSISVQILTDKGNVLHNGEGKRVLTAYVFFRGEDVSNQIYEGRFSWKRTSADETGDRIWNRFHEGIGRKCTITDEDVDRNAVFSCEIDISNTWLDLENQ